MNGQQCVQISHACLPPPHGLIIAGLPAWHRRVQNFNEKGATSNINFLGLNNDYRRQSEVPATAHVLCCDEARMVLLQPRCMGRA
jgi:hypothetical protein